jgi:hypothetical protein
LLLPILKAALLECFDYMAWEYMLIFSSGVFMLGKEFHRCNAMKDKFEEAEVELEENLRQIK